MTKSDFKNPRAKHDFVGRTCSISAVGSYVPQKVLTNADLETLVDTSNEWILSRTGIHERRIAAANEFTSDMAAKAAMVALNRAEVNPNDFISYSQMKEVHRATFFQYDDTAPTKTTSIVDDGNPGTLDRIISGG